MRVRIRWTALAVAAMILCLHAPARAWQAGTLHSGSKGEDVRQMQEALISLGYLGGTADGVFGTNTENAVRKFQRANRLTSDGLAGTKTLSLIYEKAGKTKSSSASTSKSSSASSSSSSAASSSNGKTSSAASSSASSSGSLFGGNYTTLRPGSTGSRVTALQKALISLGYLSGSADGKYGAQTKKAVAAYQKAKGLTADGLAGKKTLTALEGGSDSSSGSSGSSSGSSSGKASSSKTVSGPSGAKVKLLHWYNDIKPNLSNGQTLTIYDPSSGLGWELRVYSRGRHCDAEPRTAEDTANMLKAFGGQNTWSQKAVYVKLPSGVWTIGSTHDMPHESGSIKNNNFNGHLCVHFLRDMSETQEKDPSYGVSNQNTIRAFWKSLTGETISY